MVDGTSFPKLGYKRQWLFSPSPSLSFFLSLSLGSLALGEISSYVMRTLRQLVERSIVVRNWCLWPRASEELKPPNNHENEFVNGSSPCWDFRWNCSLRKYLDWNLMRDLKSEPPSSETPKFSTHINWDDKCL